MRAVSEVRAIVRWLQPQSTAIAISGVSMGSPVAALVSHLESHAPWGARVTVRPGGVAAPYSGRTGGRGYVAAHSALAEAWGAPAVDIGVGGSIPFIASFAEAIPDAEILITAVEDPDARAHGANESLHLAVFERACLAEALLLDRLAGGHGEPS